MRTPRPLALLFLLLLGTTVIQLFPLISVPITDIRLAYFDVFEYGALGWCISHPKRYCTKGRIGYKVFDLSVSDHKLALPSQSKYAISKLLFVHIIAFALNGVVCLMIFCTLVTPLKNSALYILICALLSMALFFFSLLGFLVDIMLFKTCLNWPGWLILVAAVSSAVCGSVLWSLHRSIIIRNYTRMRSSNQRTTVETYELDDVTSDYLEEEQEGEGPDLDHDSTVLREGSSQNYADDGESNLSHSRSLERSRSRRLTRSASTVLQEPLLEPELSYFRNLQ